MTLANRSRCVRFSSVCFGCVFSSASHRSVSGRLRSGISGAHPEAVSRTVGADETSDTI
jgi:hypothetical protein